MLLVLFYWKCQHVATKQRFLPPSNPYLQQASCGSALSAIVLLHEGPFRMARIQVHPPFDWMVLKPWVFIIDFYRFQLVFEAGVLKNHQQ